jgi:phage terminase Nu1 subunit (DNA packaging protein)
MDICRLSQKVAAELLGVTPRAMRDWPDAPRNPDGTYPGPDLVAWFIERRTPDAAPEVEDQRQRLAAAQAEKVEHENAVRRGELARMDDVVRFWTDCIANTRARLLGMPSKLAPQLVNITSAPVIQSAIRAEVYAALTELSQYEPTESTTTTR